MLLEPARETPAAEAFRWLGGDADEVASLTFGELDQRARVIARAVAAEGLVGERVVLTLTQDSSWWRLFWLFLRRRGPVGRLRGECAGG